MHRHAEKVQTLDAAFRPLAEAVIRDMTAAGWHIRVVWGRRTQAENDSLLPFSSRSSQHLHGRALDIIDERLLYNVAPGDKYSTDLERIAKKHGLVWGGSFMNKWDPTHVELP
jgi:hypothetical protein